MKKNKFLIIFFLIVIVFIGVILNIFNDADNKNKKVEINSNFDLRLSKYVLIKDYVDLYSVRQNKLKKVGKVGSGVTLVLEPFNDDYYMVVNISEGDNIFYVKSSDNIVNVNYMTTYDNRYKNYIVFNYNVKTINKTKLYDQDNNLVYSIDVSYSLPIIIMNDDKYGVEFDNRILYIKKEDGLLIANHNTDLENVKGISVLNYHFFYDDSSLDEIKDCNQIICSSKSQLKMHLDYIKENNFFTPTMNELEMYIDGKINLPKSVVITIDDSWRADIGIKMLTEYKINATMFLVTSWANVNDFKTEYVEVHSHSDNMHNIGDCPIGQGGGIQCLPEEIILNDLKVSSDKIGGTTVFCYPYYEYNDYSIKVLKKAGYTMAFAGQNFNNDNLVKVGSDKYRLPRFVIYKYTSMNQFIDYLNVR